MQYQERESDVLNPETEIHYALLSSYNGRLFPHYHDFFEVFLLLEGEQEYSTSECHNILQPGSLMLVRPGEVHSRAYTKPGRHINLAFSHQIAESLFSYLGPGFPTHELMTSTKPPCVLLTPGEKNKVKQMLEDIGSTDINNVDLIKTQMRILVMRIFITYFSNSLYFSENTDQDWFEHLLYQMETNRNYIHGLERMIQLSGRSHEHLCRVFKAKMNCTPIHYINKLKLNYAANQLIHTDSSILDICLDVGFSNLSYFYRIFQEEYGLSPAKFRHQYQSTKIDAKFE